MYAINLYHLLQFSCRDCALHLIPIHLLEANFIGPILLVLVDDSSIFMGQNAL